MSSGANVGSMELKVVINTKDVTSELSKSFKDWQSQADQNTVVYKITGDKSNLEAKLKEIQSMNPELLTKLRLDFDKSDYDKKMTALKNTVGKTASQIGTDFKTSIESSLKGFDISQVIGKKLGKNDLLNEKDVVKVKDVLQTLRQQTEGFDLSKVTSITEINDYVIALGKIDVLLGALSKHTDKKSIKLDGKSFDIAQMLQQNTSSIDNVMKDVGSVIHANASKWMTDLESAFNAEYGSIISMLENLAKGIQGILGGAGSGTGSGSGANSQALDDLKEQLKEVDEQIKNTEASIERLNKLKNESFREKSQRQNSINNKNNEIYDFYGKNKSVLGGISEDPELIKENAEIINTFKTLMQEYIDLGGKFSELKAFKAAEPAKILGLSEKDFSTEGISKQIEVLTTDLNKLNELKKDLSDKKEQLNSSGGQPQTSNENNKNGTPTTTTVSPELSSDFKEKLQEKVTNIGAVDATIGGKLSETFKTDVQTKFDDLGTVDMGVSFTDKVKDGDKKQEIPVDVTATPKLSDTFKDDLQKKVDELGTYEVKVDLKQTDKEESKDVESTLINVKPENTEEFKNLLNRNKLTGEEIEEISDFLIFNEIKITKEKNSIENNQKQLDNLDVDVNELQAIEEISNDELRFAF